MADSRRLDPHEELVGSGRLELEVADDGIGGADPTLGSGLRGLEDRVESLDGALAIWSPEGGGTTLRATIPVAPRMLPL